MSTAESERKLFKDWFDRDAAKALAKQLASVQPGFDEKRFIQKATQGLSSLEFHQRVQQFSDALAERLPPAPESLNILTKSLPKEQVDCESVTDGWLQWPLGFFISDHGLDHFEDSMTAMTELTKRFSAEFAVRAFIEKYPERTFERLMSLTSHKNPHVRRWCSEGCRPRLPWGRKLHTLVRDPSPIWPILEALKDDPELYVRRSVANNLNDIAKDHPQAVVKRCRAWKKNQNPGRDWLIKHGLRTLIKQGDFGALAIIGFDTPHQVTADLKIKPKRITLGESVDMELTISNGASKSQQLMIDYVVHFVRSNGTTSEKVFKWKTLCLESKSSETLLKKHPMKKTTTRALYPGKHNVEIQVNGVRITKSHFKFDPLNS